MAATFRGRLPTATATITAGSYSTADGDLYFANPATLTPSLIRFVGVLIESLGAATGALVELWILREGGDQSNIAHWFYSGKATTAAVGFTSFDLGIAQGVLLRVKSGGTAGSVAVSAWAGPHHKHLGA